AFAAGILDRLATALALRAGAFDREEALRGAHASRTRAQRTGNGRTARHGARARTFRTLDGGRHMDLRGLAGKGFLQRDLHVVAQIGTTLPSARGATLAAAHHRAEYILEDVGEAAPGEALAAAGAAILESGMAETIIGGAFLRILEDLVGLVDFLELMLAGLVAGVAIGMVLHGELAEGGLQLLLVGPLANAERLVKISLHRVSRHFPAW